MRYYFRLFSGVVIIAALGLSSCTKKIDEAYQNPNAAVKQPVELIFPAMIGAMLGNASGAANSFGLGGDIINIGRYVQYWGSYQSTATTDNGGTAFDKMAGVSGSGTNMANVWGMFYFAQGANINRIIEWGIEQQKWDFAGAALALRGWGMLEASNQYGEIIVREAFDASRLQFDYDDQASTYDSVRSICNRALDYLNQTGGGVNAQKFGQSDFYLNSGDVNRWKKFTYGVLARSYAYLHNKTNYSADSVILYAKLSCATNDDNSTLKFQNGGTSGTKNYMGSFRGNVNNTGTGLRQSAYIANLMSGANPGAFTGVSDPRCWYILRENSHNTFKGFSPSWSSAINGPALAPGDSSQSFVGTAYQTAGYLTPEQGRYIFRDAAEFPIMTASEMQFILAEAYLRKGDFANAKIAYVNGISLNFDMLTTKYNAIIPAGHEITAQNKADYLADPNIVPVDPTGMTLTRIMLQKYIALYGWGAEETWTDMRRYHYKDTDPDTNQQIYAGFVVPSGVDLWAGPNSTGSNNGKLVQRTRPSYNSEYLYNIPSLTAIGAYPPGNDYHTKECWFSQRN